MSTIYIKRGSKFQHADQADLQVYDTLPVGTYTIGFDPNSGQFFFEIVDAFVPLKKVYGDTLANADRIMRTFLDRPSTTGVMLSGEKGSGKTLLAKQLSIKATELGIVTILINAPWKGEGFNTFIQSIEQPALMLFDEFEKVYDDEDQSAVLTLLDGTYSSKKLFVMTCNDKYKLSTYMHNRPGRFYYALAYKGVSEKFIREYCQDNLNDKSKIESIVRYSATFEAFNFDILKAMVEEMNRYSESVRDVLKFLNVSSDSDTFEYEIVRFVPDVSNEMFTDCSMAFYDPNINGGHRHSVSKNCFVQLYLYRPPTDEDDYVRPSDTALICKVRDHKTVEEMTKGLEYYDHQQAQFTFENIVEFTGETIIYKNGNSELHLKKKSYSSFDTTVYF